MIVPEIRLTDPVELTELLSAVRRWRLTGKLIISNVGREDIELIEKLLEHAGGLADISIELNDADQADSLRLLNAGASAIICDGVFEEIPPERLVKIGAGMPDPSSKPGSVVRLAAPDAITCASLVSTGIDVAVNVLQLEEEPQLIADVLRSVLKSDRPDGLWPTVIVDPIGTALGLAYSNYESLLATIQTRNGTYWSRSRNELWVKGKTSGATQSLISIRFDCDRDCLRFQVNQKPPGFCHKDIYTCFGEERTIQTVMHRLAQRIEDTDAKSYTKKLATDPELLRSKLLEEAQELSEADTQHETAWEAADVLYFSLVAMIKRGVSLDDVFHELARRMNRVVRRKEKPGSNG